MINLMQRIWHRSRVVANSAEPMKMALVVRGDLQMTKGKTSAQCAHAAVMCVETARNRQPALLNAWLSLGQPKIVLRVASLREMDELVELAGKLNVINGLVRDAGKTQLTPGTITVLGLGPDTVTNIDAIAKQLKLL